MREFKRRVRLGRFMRGACRFAMLAASMGVGAKAPGQCMEWFNTGAAGPEARQNHAAAYDGESLMIFGGFNLNVGTYGDTWLWDGSSWTTPDILSPPARSVHKMAYDVDSDKVILFGGSDGVAFDDTWE